MNTKTTTIVRTLLGSKALWVGLAILATQPVIRAIWPYQGYESLALLVGFPTMMIGLILGIGRLNRLIGDRGPQSDDAYWDRYWRDSDDERDRWNNDTLNNPAYSYLPSNIYHDSHH